MAFDLIPANGGYWNPLPQSWHWDPKLVPLFDEGGRQVPKNVARGVARSDTDEIIGVVGNKYTPIPHQPLIETVDRALLGAGIAPLDVRKDAGMYENGAKMLVVYRLPQEIEAKPGDKNRLQLVLRTSHDMRWSCGIEAGYFRIACANKLVIPRETARIRARHTGGFDLASLTARIAGAIEMMATDREFFMLLARTRVTREQARWFFSETIARRPHAFKGSLVYEDKVEAMLRAFDQEDQTAWGVYNTLTAWSTHVDETSRGQWHNVTTQREAQVLGAMRSPAFKQLVAA